MDFRNHLNKRLKKKADIVKGKMCGCGHRRANRYLFVNSLKKYKCTKCGKLHSSITNNSEIEKYL